MIANVSVCWAITLDTYCANKTQNALGFKLPGTTLNLSDGENKVGVPLTFFQLKKNKRTKLQKTKNL